MEGSGWANFSQASGSSTNKDNELDSHAPGPEEELDDFGGFETADLDAASVPEATEVPSWAVLTTGSQIGVDVLSSEGTPSSSAIQPSPGSAATLATDTDQDVHADPSPVPTQQLTPPAMEKLQSELDKLQQSAQEDQQTKAQLNSTIQELMIKKSTLETDYEAVRSSLSSQEAKYAELEKSHQKEVEGLKKASHTALAVIVEEYKELSRLVVVQQREVCESEFKEKLQEEIKSLTGVIEQERESTRELLETDRARHNAEREEALEKQSDHYKSIIQDELAKLKAEFCKEQEEVVNLHKGEVAAAVELALQEERGKHTETLATLKEEYAATHEKMCQDHTKVLQEAIKTSGLAAEEMRKSQQSLFEESLKSTSKHSADITRQEMETYIAARLKADRASVGRSAAALNVFLEGARTQLQDLMTATSGDSQE